MAWEYAELSKAAKDAGGPEALVDSLIKFGERKGHKEMLPVVGIALGLWTLGCVGVQKIVKHLKDREKKSTEAALRARAELIQGINAYDVAHSIIDESEGENEEADAENG